LAYSPLAFKQLTKDKKATASSDSTASKSASVDSATPPNSESATVTDRAAKSAPESTVSGREAFMAIGALVLLVFALPALSVFGSLPMGLISALIIFIGMRQAWKMTATPELQISGPYKVGGGRAPVSA